MIIYTFIFLIIVLSSFALINRINAITPKGSSFTIPGGQFDIDVKVIITEDTSYALKYVRENLNPTAKSEDFNSRATTFVSIGGKSPIIWMPNTDDIPVINHELLHVTFDIMAWSGVPFTEDTEEVYAYQLQYLSKHFYDHINK